MLGRTGQLSSPLKMEGVIVLCPGACSISMGTRHILNLFINDLFISSWVVVFRCVWFHFYKVAGFLDCSKDVFDGLCCDMCCCIVGMLRFAIFLFDTILDVL